MTRTNETEPMGVAGLREARERLAAAREQTEVAPLPVVPGDHIHARLNGITFATGRGFMSASHVSRAGETYTVTAALIEASYSASGRSWLAHLASDDAQLAAWGEVRFGLGPAPKDLPTWNAVGDVEWTRSRDAAKAEAWAMPTAEARAEALAAVNERFGPIQSTAQYWVSEDPSIKAAAAQQKALDEGGIRFSQHVEAREAGVTGERR